MRRMIVIATLFGLVILGLSCSPNDNTSLMTNSNNSNNSNSSLRNTNNANTANSNRTETGATPSSADRAFMTEAAQGGMAEVELGRWAAQHATNPDVKKFGQRMVDDHSKANTELKQLAASKSLTLPTDLNDEQKQMRDKLMKLTGPNFDREYMKAMVDDHVEDVKKFETEQSSASDPDLKTFVTKTLPVLREHLQLAQETAKKVGAK